MDKQRYTQQMSTEPLSLPEANSMDFMDWEKDKEYRTSINLITYLPTLLKMIVLIQHSLYRRAINKFQSL
jgi:hypothetical protein